MRTCPVQSWTLWPLTWPMSISGTPWPGVLSCHKRGKVCCPYGAVVPVESACRLSRVSTKGREWQISLGRKKILCPVKSRIGCSSISSLRNLCRILSQTWMSWTFGQLCFWYWTDWLHGRLLCIIPSNRSRWPVQVCVDRRV